jgi:hypothetical protein
MKATARLASAVFAAAGLWLGCNQIIGLDAPQHRGTGGASSSAASSSSASSSASTSTSTSGTGGSSSAGSSSGAGGTGGSGPTLPPLTAASHLQLWLTADRGVTCTASLAGTWADQSGHHRDATTPAGGMPPQCGVHGLNDIDVPYFSAPAQASGPYTDETLDVDLSFLAGPAYTIFVVERRWADRPLASTLIGTTIPDEATQPACSSGTPPLHQALAFGYVYYDGFPELGSNTICGGFKAQLPTVPAPPPAPAAFDMLRFDPAVGEQLWVNGTMIASLVDMAPQLTASGGALGRAPYLSQEDDRFAGDIAEVIVFDAALSTADQQAVEGYLKAHWKQAFAP